MKKLITIILFSLSFVHSNAQNSPVITDTLQWLKTNIEQKNNYYHGKPLHLLLDSLYGLKSSIKCYMAIMPKSLRNRDTSSGYDNNITIYFANIYDKGNITLSHFNDINANTHVPQLKIYFTTDVPFKNYWLDTDRKGLGSVMWNSTLENFYSPYLVDSVSVGEY